MFRAWWRAFGLIWANVIDDKAAPRCIRFCTCHYLSLTRFAPSITHSLPTNFRPTSVWPKNILFRSFPHKRSELTCTRLWALRCNEGACTIISLTRSWSLQDDAMARFDT